MRKYVAAWALAAVAAAGAGATFTPAQVVHFEPLGQVEISPNKLLADTVVLQLNVDEKGNVTDVSVWSSSKDKAIDDAALAAAKKCTFLPAVQNGQPIASFTQIYYRLSAYKRLEYTGTGEKKAGTAATKPETAAPPPKKDDAKNKSDKSGK